MINTLYPKDNILWVRANFGWSILSNRKQALYNEAWQKQNQNKPKNNTIHKSLQLNHFFNVKEEIDESQVDESQIDES